MNPRKLRLERTARSMARAAGVIDLLRDVHGVDVSQLDPEFLLSTVDVRRGALGTPSLAEYTKRLAVDSAEAQALESALLVSYTEFFRNPLTFAVLEQVVIPALMLGAREREEAEVRVWSAGCATGEEAWSLAMLFASASLQSSNPSPGRAVRQDPVSFRIFATDRSTAALNVARSGLYDQSAVNNVRLGQLRNFFLARDDTYEIAPSLRERVDFSVYDLCDEHSASPPSSLYGDFDLVLCCNVLFYYQAAVQQRLLDKIHRAMAPGGYFASGEVEREQVARHPALRTVGSGVPVFQKRGTS